MLPKMMKKVGQLTELFGGICKTLNKIVEQRFTLKWKTKFDALLWYDSKTEILRYQATLYFKTEIKEYECRNKNQYTDV